MKQTCSFVISCVAAAVLMCGCDAGGPAHFTGHDQWSHYGTVDHALGEATPATELAGNEQDVVITGTITDVCAKKGCWMKVVDGDEEVFVRFQDYAFFVPRNAAGHAVVLHGVAETKVTSVDELRHYAEDAGKSAEEIAAITEPESRMTIYADSVYIAGDGLDAPWSSEDAEG